MLCSTSKWSYPDTKEAFCPARYRQKGTCQSIALLDNNICYLDKSNLSCSLIDVFLNKTRFLNITIFNETIFTNIADTVSTTEFDGLKETKASNISLKIVAKHWASGGLVILSESLILLLGLVIYTLKKYIAASRRQIISQINEEQGERTVD